MYRFAFRGRWIAGLLLVLLAAAVCVRLGVWQLDRREQRLSSNERVTTRGQQPPAPLADVLPARASAEGEIDAVEHRRVEVRGRYDGDHELLVLARSLNGTPGMHVVTPLVTGDGEAVLVNRGFVPLTDPDAAVPGEAKPPAGTVELVGTFRTADRDARFFPATPSAVATGTVGHVTRIGADRLERELPYELTPGYVRIEAEASGRDELPLPLPPPVLGEGPHLGYAIQWFGFAAVFLAGWPLLVRHTARKREQRRAGGDGRGGEGREHPGEAIRVPVAGWG